MADMRHVDTHLMRAACLQPTFDQRCIVQNFTHLIMRDRVLSAALMLGSHFLAIMRRSTDPGIDGAAEGRGAAAYNGIIAPIYAVSGKLSGQTLMRLVCFEIGKHTSELQSLMRISYAVFFLKKKK